MLFDVCIVSKLEKKGSIKQQFVSSFAFEEKEYISISRQTLLLVVAKRRRNKREVIEGNNIHCGDLRGPHVVKKQSKNYYSITIRKFPKLLRIFKNNF